DDGLRRRQLNQFAAKGERLRPKGQAVEKEARKSKHRFPIGACFELLDPRRAIERDDRQRAIAAGGSESEVSAQSGRTRFERKVGELRRPRIETGQWNSFDRKLNFARERIGSDVSGNDETSFAQKSAVEMEGNRAAKVFGNVAKLRGIETAFQARVVPGSRILDQEREVLDADCRDGERDRERARERFHFRGCFLGGKGIGRGKQLQQVDRAIREATSAEISAGDPDGLDVQARIPGSEPGIGDFHFLKREKRRLLFSGDQLKIRERERTEVSADHFLVRIAVERGTQFKIEPSLSKI